MNPSKTEHPSWSRALTGSTFLGLLPYLDRIAFTEQGIDLLGSLYPGWILALFAALGALAGTIFLLRAALGGVISCAIGLALLTASGFIGGGGDGDLFYPFAALGSAFFSFSALIAGILYKRLARRASVA